MLDLESFAADCRAAKKARALLEDLGFTVGRFTVSMGLLPEIHTSITGAIENIHEDALRKLLDERQAEPLLVSMLKALITLRRFWGHIELKPTNVTIKVALRLRPNIASDAHGCGDSQTFARCGALAESS